MDEKYKWKTSHRIIIFKEIIMFKYLLICPNRVNHKHSIDICLYPNTSAKNTAI